MEGDPFGRWSTGPSVVSVDARLLAPVAPPQIVCIGRNYRAHCEEGHADVPDHPIVFVKTITTVTGPDTTILLPTMAPDEVDYEAELGVVIGKAAKNIAEDEVDDHVLGYTCCNDVSARDCQLRIDKQWARGKGFDTFCPVGPWIETDLDPTNANVRLTLNGKEMQNGNTSLMLFPVRTLVSYLSRCMTLLPGSIILTGTSRRRRPRPRPAGLPARRRHGHRVHRRDRGFDESRRAGGVTPGVVCADKREGD